MNRKVLQVTILIIIFFTFYISYKTNITKQDYLKINLCDNIKTNTIKEGKIAPGTSGSFYICLSAKKNIEYYIKIYNETINSSNIYFMIEGNEHKYYDIKELFDKNFCGIISKGDKIVKEIKWYWDYENTNEDFKFNYYSIELKVVSREVTINEGE